MTINGLTINKEQFNLLPRTEKDIVIFDNLEFIRNRVKTWNLKINIQYGWLLALTMTMGWIIQQLINL